MRWLFWVLVLANLVGFYWFNLSSEHRANRNIPQSLIDYQDQGSGGKSLALVREVGVPEVVISEDPVAIEIGITTKKVATQKDIDVLAAIVDPVRPEPEEISIEEVKPSLAEAKPDNVENCLLVGPLSEETVAIELKDVLVSEEIVTELYERDAAGKEDYWMIIPPLAGKEEAKALLRELQGHDVDSYIISEGDYKNGITLGVFGDAENTKKYQDEVKALGYSVEIKPLPRISTAFWLEINRKTVAELPDLVVQKLHDNDGMERSDISEIVCGEYLPNSSVLSRAE